MKDDWIDYEVEMSYEDQEVPILEPREYLDDAIVGLGSRWQDGEEFACVVYDYDYDALLESFTEMFRDDNNPTPEQDAQEWVDYNTVRSLLHMGPNAPILMVRRPDAEVS